MIMYIQVQYFKNSLTRVGDKGNLENYAYDLCYIYEYGLLFKQLLRIIDKELAPTSQL